MVGTDNGIAVSDAYIAELKELLSSRPIYRHAGLCSTVACHKEGHGIVHHKSRPVDASTAPDRDSLIDDIQTGSDHNHHTCRISDYRP